MLAKFLGAASFILTSAYMGASMMLFLQIPYTFLNCVSGAVTGGTIMFFTIRWAVAAVLED